MDDFVTGRDFSMSIEVLDDGQIECVGMESSNSHRNLSLARLPDGGGPDAVLDGVALVEANESADVGGRVEGDEDKGFALGNDGDSGEVVVLDVELVEEKSSLLLIDLEGGTMILLQPDLDNLLLVSTGDIHGRDTRPGARAWAGGAGHFPCRC